MTSAASPEQRMRADLEAAGISEESLAALLNSRTDYPQAVPLMVDWLEHLDERVPAADNRDGWRAALLRNLITKHARGDQRAFDVVLAQFQLDPPLTNHELEAATLALVEIGTAAHVEAVGELLDQLGTSPRRWHLVKWLGKFKSPAAIALSERLLRDPDAAVRYQAVQALARQRARGVREQVTALLDDPDPDVGAAARQALTKLPAADG